MVNIQAIVCLSKISENGECFIFMREGKIMWYKMKLKAIEYSVCI